MEQVQLKIAVALITLALMAWMIGYGAFLRMRGVRSVAVAEAGTNWPQRLLMVGAGVLDLYLVARPFLPALDGLVGAHPSPSPTAAVFILVAGALIIIMGQSGMGRSWRVGVPSEERHIDALVTGGLHRFSRNPVYLGIMMFLVGVCVAAPGPLTIVALVVSFAGLNYVIAKEEQYLKERFGAQYEEYARRVRRWI